MKSFLAYSVISFRFNTKLLNENKLKHHKSQTRHTHILLQYIQNHKHFNKFVTSALYVYFNDNSIIRIHAFH